MEEDPTTGDLTVEMREKVEAYIQRVFCEKMSRENVCFDNFDHSSTDSNILIRYCRQIVWFRNWSALKSIHAVEHIHVFLKGPDEFFIQEITKGDKPAYLKTS